MTVVGTCMNTDAADVECLPKIYGRMLPCIADILAVAFYSVLCWASGTRDKVGYYCHLGHLNDFELARAASPFTKQ